MESNLEGWAFSARRLLQRLRRPAALEIDAEGVALRDALGTATVFDAVRISVDRALAHADPRLASILERCDFGDDTVKAVAMDLHMSLRHVFRFRAMACEGVGAEMKRAVETRLSVPRDVHRAEAARLLARAQFLLWRRGPGDDARAIVLAEQALESDPMRADAWSLIAMATISQSLLAQIDGDVAQARASAAVERAQELGCNAGVVFAIRSAMASVWTHEWSLARSLASEALGTAEGAAGGHHTMTWLALHEREYDRAERHAAAACLAEPGRWIYHQLSAAIVHLRGDYARCAQRCAELHALAPEDPFVLGYYTEALNAAGRHDETIAVVNAAPPATRDFSVMTALARAHALTGDRAKARDIARRMRGPAVSTAAIALTLGDEDAALAALERAMHERNGMLDLTQFDPVFEPFWSEARYQKIVS